MPSHDDVTLQPPAGITWYPITLERWHNAEVVIVRDEHGLWFPVTHIARIVGVNPTMQAQRLQRDERYADYRTQLPIPSARGIRLAWCVKRSQAGLFVLTMDAARVAEDARPELELLQRTLAEAADRLMFGDEPQVIEIDREAGVVRYARPTRGELHMSCPACQAPLCLTIDEGGAHLFVAEETD